MTALHVAAQYGQIDFVREMLTKVPATTRSEVPQSSDFGAEFGLTPLHLAAQSGHEGLVRLLLNFQGVQVDAATSIQVFTVTNPCLNFPMLRLLSSKAQGCKDY